MPVQSRMPAGLTSEEKREYQKERNRRKQAALRSRRLAKLKEAEEGSANSSPEAGPSGLQGEVTRLEGVVGRLVGMLRGMGVEEGMIERALSGDGGEGEVESRMGSGGGRSSAGSSTASSRGLDSPATLVPALCQDPFAMDAGTVAEPTSSSEESSPFGGDGFGLHTPVDFDFLGQDVLFESKPLHHQPADDIFNLLAPAAPPVLAPPTPSLQVDRLRLALNLTHQPVPSSLNWNAPFSDFSDHSNMFFGGGTAGGFGLAGFGSPYEQPQPQWQGPPVPLPVETPDASWKRTLFELHLAYRTSRRRARLNPTYRTEVSESAIKEVQKVIFTLLNATSDQHSAYFGSEPALSPEDQAFYDSDEMDERVRLMPTALIVKVVTGRAAKTGLFDLSTMLAEVIESSRIHGDVYDITGWTMPPSFWVEYPFEAPRELDGKCNDSQHVAIPLHLKGATIRDIVLGLEQPGWRMAGPFPLPQARIEAEGWETTLSEGTSTWKGGRQAICLI